MVRTVLPLFLAAGLLFSSCRSTKSVEQQLDPVAVPSFSVLINGDSVHVLPAPVAPARRGFLGIGTGKNKVKNSGNVTVNITHTDKSKTKTDTDVSSVDKSKVKTDVVSKPTTTIKNKVDSKSKTDDHSKSKPTTKTKTTQGGQLALIGIGAAVVFILFLLFRRKKNE